MAMTITGIVGAPQASVPPGTSPPAGARMINTQELGMSEVHGRYYESTYRGGRFAGGMQAPIANALQVGLTTASVGGLCLFNPNGSNVNAVVEKVSWALILAQTTAGWLGIGVGQSTAALSGTLTSVNPRSRKIGSGIQPVCNLVSSATFMLPVAPTLDTIIGQYGTAATTVPMVQPANNFDFEGGLILPPGAFALFVANYAMVASSYLFGFQWEEVPA